MPNSRAKRVVLYRFDRKPVEGLVNPAAYLLEAGVEFMSLDGNIQQISYAEVKALCFVSDTGSTDLFTDHSLFERRPKVPGLWTRFTLRDADRLDGILSHNLIEWPASGYLITPPRVGISRQRVFLPRAAVAATELRGVVGASAISVLTNAKAKTVVRTGQLSMFD